MANPEPSLVERAERRASSAVLGLAALAALLALWKSYSLGSTNFRVQEQWSAWTYASACAQDALAWLLLALAWQYALQRWRFGLAALIALAELWLLFQLVDARMKVRFLHPLSVQWLEFAAREFDTIGPDYKLFTGSSYWGAALASLAALGAAFALPWIPPVARGVKPCAATFARTGPILALAALSLVAASFVLPAQPYGLHKNFVTATLMPHGPAPRGARGHERMPSAEPLRRATPDDFASTSDPNVAVARGWNVVLYVLESTALAQTSLGTTGLDTTPFLRELVERGALSVPCYAQIANSAKATYSLYSGSYASTTMEVLECEIERTQSLARTLSVAGYHTALISPQTLYYQGQRTMFRNMGFDEVVGFHDLAEFADQSEQSFPQRGPAANDDRLMFVWPHERLPSRQPFFVSYYTQSTHFPYQYAGSSGGADQERHARALEHADRVLRELVELYQRLGLHEKTLYVVTADHGEDFVGGKFAPRNSSLAENGHRVPLVIYAPGVDLRRWSLPTARHIDVVPTVLDLLGLGVSEIELQGRSLFDGRGERPIFLGSYGTEQVLGWIEGGRKWGYDVESETLRTVDLASDPSGRAWSAAPAEEHADLVRRMRELALYDEACLRDLAER